MKTKTPNVLIEFDLEVMDSLRKLTHVKTHTVFSKAHIEKSEFDGNMNSVDVSIALVEAAYKTLDSDHYRYGNVANKNVRVGTGIRAIHTLH